METTLTILRQDGPSRPETRRWESRAAPVDAVTVADALMAHRDVAWDDRCTWPSCGTCMMVIAGRARPACSTPLREVADRKGVVRLTPLGGFQLRRDLWVERESLLEGIADLSPWIDEPGTTPEPSGAFSRCTRCGACLDACPEARLGGWFVGAAAIALSHDARHLQRDDPRLDAVINGGIAECGGAHACVDVCPEGLPLDDALREASIQATRHAFRRLFSGSSRSGSTGSGSSRSDAKRDA